MFRQFATRIAHRPVLRLLLTAAGVLLLSVFLALWRHNGSTYYTGLWDDGSQALVFGRMLQMQQDQSAPGGFMGVYTEEWGDNQNRYMYRDNAPVEPEQFQSYTHQTGLQGWAFGVLNKVFSVIEDRGEAREQMLYTTNSVLFYAVTLCLCLVVLHVVGALPALTWLAAALLAPWVQRGMKDLYWCLWLWWLPALAGIALCVAVQRRGHAPAWAFGGIFAACLLRCLCGFEFISTFLILCEIPLVYCWSRALCRREPAQPWVLRMVGAGFSAVGGVAAALVIWLAQGVLYYGNLADSWQNVAAAVTSRVSVSDDAVRAVTVPQVLQKYLMNPDPVLQIGPLGVSVLGLLLATTVSVLVTAILLRWLDPAALLRLPPLLCVWGLSFLAPVSWMVLSKAHADIHVQLIPMLWNFAFVPVSCMLLGALVSLLVGGVFRRCRKS